MGNTFRRREHCNLSNGGENGEKLDVVIKNRRDSETEGEDGSHAEGQASRRRATTPSKRGDLLEDGPQPPHTDLVEV